jgi:hypothetical protein
MKASRLIFTLLFASSVAVVQLAAQQTKADQKPIGEVKAKAEAGDAQSQVELGLRYDKGATSLYSSIRKSAFNCLMRCSVVSVILVQRSTGAAEPPRNWSAANAASASRNAIHAR